MSNCVEVYTPVRISSHVFDIDKLLDDMKKHDYVNEPGYKRYFGPEATDEEFYFYWFVGEDNFIKEDNTLVISLGHHRSSHTWRDFRGLERFLSQYLLIEEDLECLIYMGDESDGFDKKYKGTFTISNKGDN